MRGSQAIFGAAAGRYWFRETIPTSDALLTLARVLALLSNAKKYGRERLNSACGRALLIGSPTRSSVESILKQGLDQVPVESSGEAVQDELSLDHHENVRGEDYYH